LQGIAKRVIDGNNAGTNGFEVGQQTEPVAILGSQILKRNFLKLKWLYLDGFIINRAAIKSAIDETDKAIL